MHVHSTGAGNAEHYGYELREILRAYAETGIAVTLVADLRDGETPVYAGEAAFLAGLPGDLRQVVAAGRFVVRDGACLLPEASAQYAEPDGERLELLVQLRPHVAAHYSGWAAQSGAESSS